MSYPVVIHWEQSDANTDAIASAQSVTAGNNLTLVSNVPNLPGRYIYDKVIRQLSFTSPNDNSGATFVITGIGSPVDGDGNPTQVIGPITESKVGPTAAGTILSDNIYKEIISIQVTVADSDTISVGFGPAGITDYVFLDYNRTIFQTSVQLQFVSRTTLTATVYTTLSKPETPNIQYGTLIPFSPLPAFPVSVALTNATANQLGAIATVASLTWANMKATAADSLYFTVLQQGIT